MASMAVLVVQPGLVRLAAASVATLLLVLVFAKLLEADYYRRRAAVEQQVVQGLVTRLPQQWFVLGDLELEPSWLEPVQVWATVIGPGGLAVIQPCSEHGDLTPYGHLWMVGSGRHVRAIPSPAAEACTAAEALREILGTDEIPILPVVTLTDLNTVFHKAETGADVVGAPHLAAGLAGRLSTGRRVWDGFQLAAFLARYHR